jgi:hypothetical protein
MTCACDLSTVPLLDSCSRQAPLAMTHRSYCWMLDQQPVLVDGNRKNDATHLGVMEPHLLQTVMPHPAVMPQVEPALLSPAHVWP